MLLVIPIYHGYIYASDLFDNPSFMTKHGKNFGFVEYCQEKRRGDSARALFPGLNFVEASREELLLIDIDSQMKQVNSC